MFKNIQIQRIVVFMMLLIVQGEAQETSCSPGSWLKTFDNGLVGSAYVISSAKCRICEPGYFCPGGGDRSQTRCAPGTYSTFAQSKCTTCPEGFACPNPAERPEPCGIVDNKCTYSGKGATTCTLWVVPQTGDSVGCLTTGTCKLKSHICTAEGKLVKIDEGKVGNNIVIDHLAQLNPDSTLTIGTHYNKGIFLISPCPAQYECRSGIMQRCKSGFYSPVGAIGCTQCPVGYKCPNQGATLIEEKKTCSDNTFKLSNPTNIYSIEECADICSNTDTCAVIIIQRNGNSGICQLFKEGCVYSAHQNYDIYTVSPVDLLSHTSVPIKCPAGWYQSFPGKTSCTACPKGHFCEEASSYPKKCSFGYYAPETGRSSCDQCPAGYSCSTTDSWPVPCGQTQYSEQGQAQCFDCPYGSECPLQKTIQPCNSGYYTYHVQPCSITSDCPPSPTWEHQGKHECRQCPAGSYCKRSDMQPVQCPQGYYSVPGSLECTICPVGSMCPSISQKPSACKLGYYQDKTGSKFCKKCPIGSTCAGESAQPVKCGSSQVTDVINQICMDCPQGFQCNSQSFEDITECHSGFYSTSTMNNCNICPRGKYCPKTTTEPIPCPSGTITLKEGQTYCDKIMPGWKHVDQTGLHFYKCKPGQYSDDYNFCRDCPAGEACPEFHQLVGHNHKYACLPGSYSNSTQTHCTPCPPGFECPSTTALPTACAEGKYSTGGWTSCQQCPLNHQCPRKNSISVCPVYHTSPLGQEHCDVCPDGKECKNMKIVPQACPAGYYMSVLDQFCQMCPIGHKCVGGETEPVKCSKGTYQNQIAQGTCIDCTIGYFSAEQSEICQPIPGGWKGTGTGFNEGIEACPAGKYSGWGEKDCITCPDGFVCPPASNHANSWEFSCSRGSFCIGGEQKPCPAGKTGIVERAISEETGCIDCPAGFACPEKDGNWELHPCPQGGFCKGGVSAMEACLAGFYNDLMYGQSIADCKLCPAGNECPAGSINNGVVCPEGFYCPRGTIPGTYKCPKGTYGGKQKGLKDVSQCLICPPGHLCGEATVTPSKSPAGYYQPNSGIADQTALYVCPPRFYCPNEGMVNYKGFHCKAGYYCPAGSTKEDQEPCPAGTYSDRRDLHDPLDCTPCPRGYQCAAGSTSKTLIDCTANHYCPVGTISGQSMTESYSIYAATNFIQKQCPAGYKSAINSKSLEDCVKCDYGTYCLAGSGEMQCPKGHYCPIATREKYQFPCGAGYFNDQLGKIDILDCKECGVGYYCPAASEVQTPCAAGTYNDISNTEESCITCPAGMYCDPSRSEYQLPQPNICPAGSYSDSGASECTDCKVGHYCPDKGTTKTQMLVDQICPAGTLCRRVIDNSAVLTVSTSSSPNIGNIIGIAEHPDDSEAKHGCPKGYFCPRGTEDMIKCPKGTYNPAFAQKDKYSGCRLSEPGKYVDTEAAIIQTGDCQAGYYCPLGSIIKTQYPCPIGTFRSLTAGQDQSSCGKCPSGYYCDSIAMTTPIQCPPGYYCSSGTIYPESCPIGTYGPLKGLTDSYQCTPCMPGRFCWKKGQTTQSSSQCDPGFYCMEGASRPEPIDNVSGSRCPKGAFCQLGTVTPTLCQKGQHNPNEGAFEISSCVDCYAGYYCKDDGTNESDIKCPPGFYCPLGTAVPGTGLSKTSDPGYFTEEGFSKQYKCAPGYFQSQSQKGFCDPCTGTFLCDKFGLSAEE